MFKKGEKVLLIGSWNDKGVVYITEAVVHSCGKKQMVLHRADNGSFLGSNFKPEYAPNQVYHTVIADLPKIEAEAFAIELGERFLVSQVEHYELRLAQYGNNADGSSRYLDCMLEGRAEFIAAVPSVIWR